jgi:hypothetical protein
LVLELENKHVLVGLLQFTTDFTLWSVVDNLIFTEEFFVCWKFLFVTNTLTFFCLVQEYVIWIKHAFGQYHLNFGAKLSDLKYFSLICALESK